MIFQGRRLTSDQVADLAADPSLTARLLDREDDVLDLDKAWHGIHFLLTGGSWETSPGAGEAVLGGDPVGDDLGYGPARLLPAERVQLVAAALREVTADSLRTRFDPAALLAEGIYPQVWDDEDFALYLLPNFSSLQAFYVAAAGEKQAVLLAVT
ncbi:YfbM family protein [Actinoplanes sp. NPDC048967]|uniref:YfbM family protein n=1 Tax=Actinoplanes sp. NPDC048967 TaxID=3155269 RepID=UPI0033D124E9